MVTAWDSLSKKFNPHSDCRPRHRSSVLGHRAANDTFANSHMRKLPLDIGHQVGPQLIASVTLSASGGQAIHPPSGRPLRVTMALNYRFQLPAFKSSSRHPGCCSTFTNSHIHTLRKPPSPVIGLRYSGTKTTPTPAFRGCARHPCLPPGRPSKGG